MMTVSAVNTAAIALFILGGLGYTYISLANYLDTRQSEFKLKLSIRDGADRDEIHEFAEYLRGIDGVSHAVFLPREAEWEKWREEQNLGALSQDISNPLPDQFVITLASLDTAESVKAEIGKHTLFDPEDGIRDAREEREFLTSLIGFVKLFGGLMTAVGLFTAGTLIYNTVHLTVLARRRELRTMGLIGASRSTIRWPFLMEGGLQGLAGGLVAGALLWVLASYLGPYSGEWLGRPPGGEFSYPGFAMTSVLAAVGILLGMLSAGLSVRRYLRY